MQTRLCLWAALLGFTFPAACGSSGVVGGKCRSGYVDCNGYCVDLQSDAKNCGACGHQCEVEVSCVRAICGGSDDGSAGAVGAAGAAGVAGAANEAGAAGASAAAGEAGAGGNSGGSSGGANGGTGTDAGPDGSETDSGLADAGAGGDTSCGTPPFDTPQACGDCMTQCTGNTPICSPDGVGGFMCVQNCDPPLTLCDSQCVDLNIDALHCGSCSNVCPSGICQGRKCVGANVGHVMLACMDYSTPVANSPQTVLLGNAVFLPVHSPVRILAYTQYAPAAVRAKVDQDIGFAATARSRSYTITASATFADVTAKLNINDFEVFLIYDQSTAPAGQLATIGAAWQTSTVLSSFSSAGGMIVGLSSGGGTAEMDQLFTSAQLLDVSAETDVTNQTLYNRAPADALGINVISPFLAAKSSCTFTTSAATDADTIFVIRDAASPAAGSPVVVHRVIEP